MDSCEILKSAVENVGVKKVAAEMRVSQSLVYKWCEQAGEEDDVSGARNPLDRVEELVACTGCRKLVEWLCERCDGYFVNNPDIRKQKIDAEFIAHTQRMIQNFSELLRAMSESISNDGRIDGREAVKIRREWEDLKRYAESFVAACEQGMFDKTGEKG
jgi:hypothetical protein